MSINIAGVILLAITLGIVGVELAINKWIRKVTNTYWFWLALGLFYLIYCICISWRYYWNQMSITVIQWGTPLDRETSRVLSWGLMLNICPFLNFAIPVALIADPTRKAARAIAPFGIVASFFVLFFDIIINGGARLTWTYIFIGSNEQPDLYYFGHAMNFWLAFGILLNTPKIGWKGLMGTYGFVAGFYLYVIIVCLATGCQYYCSGVTLNDFISGGTYNFFEKVFKIPRFSQGVFFLGLFGGMLGISALADTCKRGYFAYGDNCSGIWWKYYDYEKTSVKYPWGKISYKHQLLKKNPYK